MKEDKKQICSVCGKAQAKTECDNCGTAICGDCCKFEIWGSGAEDLTARYFCPTCKEDPAVNPWGARSNIPDSVENKLSVTQKAAGKKVRVAGSKPSTAKKGKARSTGYGNYRNTNLPAETGIRAAAHK
ncbi:MAG: B-box zinc finger protein [Smithellaceae bacterium]|jgi:hypothetical protein|nr:B-box zinc finger protein [Smithellaceae bacterium]HBJ74527.1 hypothetical protein [Syntrophaceae bacterium]MDD5413847.1 B-box zinc finger protein [Smithellaceae bacterium]HBL53229.1 hypothetical protein [Syntrophaceae bacterium]HCS77712.1 hypothetical protein [Syntrophaceae bacterium]